MENILIGACIVYHIVVVTFRTKVQPGLPHRKNGINLCVGREIAEVAPSFIQVIFFVW